MDKQENSFWLPGITFNSLIDLHKVSGGRIPDPVTPAREATEDKVQVVNKDGYAVLMDKDEYKEYEKQRRREAGGETEAEVPEGSSKQGNAERGNAERNTETSE